MADPLGYYAEQGIKANLLKRAGWALVRDQMMNRELDAAHFFGTDANCHQSWTWLSQAEYESCRHTKHERSSTRYGA